LQFSDSLSPSNSSSSTTVFLDVHTFLNKKQDKFFKAQVVDEEPDLY